MRALTQQMLCIDLPPLVAVPSPAALAATEYTPIAAGTRWLRLADVGVVLAAPRTWRLARGEGWLLGVPVVTYELSSPRPWVRADDGDGDAASAASPAPLTLTVRHFRGAFGSPLLAGARGEAAGVARFFTELHVIRASPPGLVTAAMFGRPAAGDSGGGGGFGGADGGMSLEHAALASLADAPTTSLAGGGGGLPGLVRHDDTGRRPDVLGSWHRTVTRDEAMDFGALAAAAAAAGGGSLLTPLPEGDGVAMHVPVALGPGAVFSPRQAQRPRAGGSPMASTATRAVSLRPGDRVDIYGLEYVMRHAPAGPRGGMPTGGSDGGMRYNVTLVCDAAADSVHEVSFAAPAALWDAAWAHDVTAPELRAAADGGPRAGGGGAGGGAPWLRAALDAPGGLARALGIEHVTARQLLDAATVVGVVPAPPGAAHEIG